MTEQTEQPSEHNRMAALQLIARQSVTRLAEILDSKDEAIATARKERDEARDKLIEVRDTLHHTNNEFAVVLRERNDAHLALAEARAEVERLLVVEKGWDAVQSWGVDKYSTGEEYLAALDANDKVLTAATRARAAKESQP